MTEKTWTTEANFLVTTTNRGPTAYQQTMISVKNHLAASGVWTVIASSNGGTYEYEGITGGGAYTGDSTGPYDVWENYGDVQYAADGSYPGWIILKGPTHEGLTPYLVFAIANSSYTLGYMVFYDEKPLLHPDGATKYLPIAPEGAVRFGIESREFVRSYGSNDVTRGYMSVCPTDGSFFYSLNFTISSYWTAFFMFQVMDRNSVPEGMVPVVIGFGTDNPFDSTYDIWFVTQASSENPETTGPATWGNPIREESTEVFATDMTVTNFEGEVDLFPFLVIIPQEVGNLEYKTGLVGRVPDMWIAPQGIANGDTLPSGSTQYYKFGKFWMVPGDTIPVLGP